MQLGWFDSRMVLSEWPIVAGRKAYGTGKRAEFNEADSKDSTTSNKKARPLVRVPGQV